ncbi:hypothetical protein THTE_2746 [Thermogutta terrifontis]|uniref:Uncharacterized protein n=1 Tax=Thermogutta terrifontis TaxID=1331910 RepID=A0A286RHB5_9BACT|nr:hypothetical protein THTE_2746 [Thermogutta terrifontis]
MGLKLPIATSRATKFPRLNRTKLGLKRKDIIADVCAHLLEVLIAPSWD